MCRSLSFLAGGAQSVANMPVTRASNIEAALAGGKQRIQIFHFDTQYEEGGNIVEVRFTIQSSSHCKTPTALIAIKKLEIGNCGQDEDEDEDEYEFEDEERDMSFYAGADCGGAHDGRRSGRAVAKPAERKSSGSGRNVAAPATEKAEALVCLGAEDQKRQRTAPHRVACQSGSTCTMQDLPQNAMP